jgi:hypothetical protein
MGVHFSGGTIHVNTIPSGSIYGDFSGPVSPVIGTTKRYFVDSVRLVKITMHTFVSVTTDVTVVLNINDVQVSSITLLTGSTTQSAMINIGVIAGDYMTLDISAGTCSDLSVRIDY